MIKKVGRLVRKGFRSIKRKGFFQTIKIAFRFVRLKFMYFRAKRGKKPAINFHDYVKIGDYTNIIVFETNLGWSKVMKQRPQQIAENLPEDTVIFYHSHDDVDYIDPKRVALLKRNVVVLDLGYHRDTLFAFLEEKLHKFLMVYSTDYIPYERIKMYEERGYKVIYEYVDDLNEELSGDAYPLLCEVYESILKDDNVYVVTTATNLKNKIEAAGKKARLVTNGVVYEHFKYSDYEVPADLAPILKTGKTTVCYYGALASWFDYELVKKIAQTGEYAVVLIGLDYDNTLKGSGVLSCENVYYLGKKRYEELPAYGCNMDICAIPFVVNDITEATSPVKLFEYMAMEKPIVTTALPECKKYKSVLYSDGHEEFIANLEKAKALANDEEYKKIEIEEALDNTWSAKASAMVDYVRACKAEEAKSIIFDSVLKQDYDRIVIWRSPFGWNVPLYQRPQHISKQLSEHNCLVLYEVTMRSDFISDVAKETDKLILVNFENYEVCQYIKEATAKIDRPVYVQIYSTNWSMSIEEVEEYKGRGYKLLYEYIDDISPELAGTEEIPEYVMDKYNYVMAHKEVPVVVTATHIYEDVISKRGEENLVFASNGVDYKFFTKLDRDFKFEDDFLKIINNGKINVCYYGALAKWFDYEIIKKIDATDKYNVILFGAKYDESYDLSGIEKLRNVYFLGSRPYKVLKNYAAKMDILMIPFLINSITQATSPVKVFEYMALEKPIVTTAMKECLKYESIVIADSPDDFVGKLDLAYSRRADKEYLEILKKEAIENDWSMKAKAIIDLLKTNE